MKTSYSYAYIWLTQQHKKLIIMEEGMQNQFEILNFPQDTFVGAPF